MRIVLLLAMLIAFTAFLGGCADDLESPTTPYVPAPDPFGITAFCSPQDHVEPVTGVFTVIIIGGSGRNTISWLSGESEIGNEAVVEVPGLMAGHHLMVVSVTDDSTHVTKTDSVTIRVLPAPSTETETFTFTPNLWVGPAQEHDSGTYDTGASDARYYTMMEWNMDVRNDERSNVIVGLHYDDGTWTFLSVPDVLPQRPATFWVNCGELRWEPTTDVHIWFEEEAYDKCNGRDTLTGVEGSRTVLAAKAGTVSATVITPPRWIAASLGL